MTFGVVTGLPSEAKLWRKLLPNVEVACFGMGPDAASCAAEHLILKGVTTLISSGIAGGLSPQASTGTVIIANRATNDDGLILECDSVLCAKWQELLPYAMMGTILTTHSVIATINDKSRLYEHNNATAVDMESFAVGQVALKSNLPFAVLRVIADPYNQTIASAFLEALREDGTLDTKLIVKALLARPKLAFNGVSLAWQSHIAHNQLRMAIRALSKFTM